MPAALLNYDSSILQTVYVCILWRVDLGQLPDTHPAALLFPLLNKAEGANKMDKLMGQDKDWESLTNCHH